MKSDTIAAIATAVSQAGIGIVRLSGEEAFQIIDKIYRPKRGSKKISKQKTHTLHYGWIVDGEERIDEALIGIMRAPNSYTKEDVVEINCHGGVMVVRKVLQLTLKNGARLANAGEFTKRAFLNGRMDLSEAEAVTSLIHAKSEAELKNSIKQLEGALSKRIRRIREELLKETAYIEAAMDDSEHYEIDGYGEKLKENLIILRNELQTIWEEGKNGRFITEGIKTIIVGKPNVGKSSLLNYILKEERAIVTEIEGTTRDTIEETIQMDGVSLRVMDTAGIRKTNEKVEWIGIQKALENMKEADFVVYVVDASKALDENDERIMGEMKEKKGVVVFNKSDLETLVKEEEIKSRINKRIIHISALKRKGIEELFEYIKEEFFKGKISYDDTFYITNERHKECVREAIESLEKVEESINEGLPEDFYTIDLMNAYQSLGRILGENIEEDLINKIFAEFCMGK